MKKFALAFALSVSFVAGVPSTRSRVWPALLASLFRTGGLLKRARFAEMVERARLDEALAHGRTVRFLASDGSALVDLLAWAEADFYAGKFDEAGLRELLHYLTGERRIRLRQWPRFARRATEVWLLNVLDLARPPVPDVLVLVEASPAETVARLRASGAEPVPWHDEAFVALADADERGAIVGVSRYAVGSDPLACEIAVTVLDAWQSQGLGTALMRRLIEAARERGLQRMVSLDFAENQEMAHLAHHLGFHSAPDPDDRTQVVHTLTL